ncbi:MAG: urate hydroxylase PuuD [Maricaulis sp.]|nr:urate hydroxylase PuuD [Maricaulis sp.]
MMDIQFDAWLSLIIRWAHIIAGIAWIGASFHFMQLDNRLKHRKGLKDGVKGEAWGVHGGGFYHSQKYMVAPDDMPEMLHWYKWDSYMTWITGFALLAVTYYWQADIYLIDRSVLELSQMSAIGLSLASLVGAWVVYDLLCKSPLKNNQLAMFGVLFVLFVGATWGLGQVFSGRAAFLHVGAMIGTIMSANVFFVIIPNQKIVVEDLKAGRTPDPEFGIIAKLRSTHNNYLTLPVLFLMISNHYPMTFGHEASWVIVAFLLPIGAVIRHWFNTHDAGGHGKALAWQWPTAIALMIAMMLFASWKPGDAAPVMETGVPDARVLEIVQTHCATCHSASPTDEYMDVAPAGLRLDTIAEIRANSARILMQSVTTNTMPPGNFTEMTDEERAVLGAWVAQ